MMWSDMMPINSGSMAASQMPWTSLPINMNSHMAVTKMPWMSSMKSGNTGHTDSSVPKNSDDQMSWNNNNNSPMRWMTESGATAQMPAQVMTRMPWNFEPKSSNGQTAPSQMSWDDKMKNNNNKGKIETPEMVWNNQPTMITNQMAWNSKSSSNENYQMPSDHSTNNNYSDNNEMKVSSMSANNKTTSDNSNNSDVDGNAFPGVTMLMRIPSHLGVQLPQQKQQKKNQMQQQKPNNTNNVTLKSNFNSTGNTSNNKQTENGSRWQSQTNFQQPQEQETVPWQSKVNNSNDESAWTNSRSSEVDQTEEPMNSNTWTSDVGAPMIQGVWDADQSMDNNKQTVEEQLKVRGINSYQ